MTIPRPEAGEEWAVDDEWEEDRLPGRLAVSSVSSAESHLVRATAPSLPAPQISTG
ncbi:MULTISPECIES: hypothetical protein [unclassified Streptomyces]|uniref:Uncharacterized protein n=1 Tax=Streptomyces sp. NBC_00060 TaxID=2975636 RepID=A0AAU2H965_9ACTN